MRKTFTLAAVTALALTGAAQAQPNRGASATLYDQPGFQGNSVTITQSAPDLGRWRFNDRASLTLGGRYTSDDKSFTGDLQTGFGNPVPRTQVSLSRTWTSFTPKLGFDYKFNDDLFGYVSAAKGAKAGGFNGLAVLNAAVLRAVFGPQNVITYEAGLKAEWLDRRLPPRRGTSQPCNQRSGNGCRVEALCPRGHPVTHTRAAMRVHEHDALRPLRALRAALGPWLLGIATLAALWGGWLEHVGPRKAGFVAALCWC